MWLDPHLKEEVCATHLINSGEVRGLLLLRTACCMFVVLEILLSNLILTHLDQPERSSGAVKVNFVACWRLSHPRSLKPPVVHANPSLTFSFKVISKHKNSKLAEIG